MYCCKQFTGSIWKNLTYYCCAAATLVTLSDLGFLWFREFYLESSRVIQVKWQLVDAGTYFSCILILEYHPCASLIGNRRWYLRSGDCCWVMSCENLPFLFLVGCFFFFGKISWLDVYALRVGQEGRTTCLIMKTVPANSNYLLIKKNFVAIMVYMNSVSEDQLYNFETNIVIFWLQIQDLMPAESCIYLRKIQRNGSLNILKRDVSSTIVTWAVDLVY